MSERRAGPETGDAGADPPRIEGRPPSTVARCLRQHERYALWILPGYWRGHVRTRRTDATREAPAVRACDPQPDARKGQAGPHEVAERPVVARKPGNSGGAKGPWLKVDAASDDGPGDWR